MFSAYLDVTYGGSGQAQVDGSIQFNSPPYVTAQTGDTNTAGIIDEVGALDGQTSTPAPDPVPLFSLQFMATSQGEVVFTGNPADLLPLHEVVLFGELEAVPPEQSPDRNPLQTRKRLTHQ